MVMFLQVARTQQTTLLYKIIIYYGKYRGKRETNSLCHERRPRRTLASNHEARIRDRNILETLDDN